MRYAVIKIGSRIAYNGRDVSGGNGEAKSIIEMLVGSGGAVDVYTKVLPKDVNPNYLTFYNIQDEYSKLNDRKYDALVVINGNINFFGGAESPDQILNYWMINNFSGRVVYVYCDPNLYLKQCWPSIEKKPWGSNWKESDINITRKDIHYVSQPYNISEVQKLVSKAGIDLSSIVHYPMENFPCMKPSLPFNENPDFDLSYGGGIRGGRRLKKMHKYYFGYSDDFRVTMFGGMDASDFEKQQKENPKSVPIFGGHVNYDLFTKEMNRSMSHVVIGDPWYEGRDMPQRCAESVWSSVVTFIDIELDPTKRVFGSDSFLSKFNYVSSREEVESRLRALKKEPKIRKKIIDLQFKCYNFSYEKFCNDFASIVNGSNTSESSY